MRQAPRLALALPAALLVGALFLLPMALVLREALAAGDAWRWLLQPYARGRLLGAALQALLSLALVLAVAVPLAWLHHAWRIPGSRFLLAVHAGTFVLPVFVVVGGLRETLGAGGWLDQATGVDLLALLGPWGAVPLANALYNAGLATRLLHTALEARPRRSETAASTLGAPPLAVLRRVTWPALRAPLAATALLVFLFCFASFGVVLFLGGGEIDTVDTLLYANLRGGFPREDRAAVLALVQVVAQAILLLGVVALERRSARQSAQPSPGPTRASTAATATAWTAAAASTLPAAAVLTGAFRVGGTWSLDAWRALAGGPGHLSGFSLPHAIGLSLAYAAGAVALAAGLSLLLAYAGRGRFATTVEALAFLPLGTSSVVLGFAFLVAFAGRPWLPLVGSPWAIVATHALLALPFVARLVLPALHGLDAALDPAAATLGAPLRSRVWRLHLPLLRGPLAAGAAFAAALSLGDYGASLLLMTADTAPVSVWVGLHGGPGAFDPLARAQSTALAAVLLALTLGAFLAAELIRPRRLRRVEAPR